MFIKILSCSLRTGELLNNRLPFYSKITLQIPKFHKLLEIQNESNQMETSKVKLRGRNKSKLFTWYLNGGEEVESQEQPEDHGANGGSGLQPLLPEEPKVWGGLKTHLPRPKSLRHPQPPPTYFSQGTWSNHTYSNHKALFHTGYYLVLMTLDFSFKGSLFLSQKKNVSHSIMGSLKSLFTVRCQSCEKLGLGIQTNKVFWRTNKASDRGEIFIGWG